MAARSPDLLVTCAAAIRGQQRHRLCGHKLPWSDRTVEILSRKSRALPPWRITERWMPVLAANPPGTLDVGGNPRTGRNTRVWPGYQQGCRAGGNSSVTSQIHDSIIRRPGAPGAIASQLVCLVLWQKAMAALLAHFIGQITRAAGEGARLAALSLGPRIRRI